MMLSRVADAIYWMSRYLERAENIARLIDVDLQLMLDKATEEQAQWEPLASITGDVKWFHEKYGPATQESITKFLTFDREYPNSIISCLTAARENARSIRDVISSEFWQETNRFYLTVNDSKAEEEAGLRPHQFYEQLRRHGYLCNGVCDFTMTHNDGWHFSQVGRLLERADKTTRILDVKYFMLLPKPDDVGRPIDVIQWSAVLNSASAFEMHRRRYREIQPTNVAEFLIAARGFPRSIYFSLDKAEISLRAITGSPPGTFVNEVEQKLGALRAELSFVNVSEIVSSGLHEFLDNLQRRMNAIDNAMQAAYFAIQPISNPAELDNSATVTKINIQESVQ
jgi:uncharacterized alpha-E superfamily protein